MSITDDDTPGVTIEPAALSVVAGRSNEYTAALATEPTGEVTLTISGHAGTAVTPDNTTLTFTVGNWSMAQTVTVSATQNAATAKVTLTHAVAGRTTVPSPRSRWSSRWWVLPVSIRRFRSG